MARVNSPEAPRYRIRRCTGNRRAWIMSRLLPSGDECQVSGTYWTSLDIDGLFTRAAAHIGPEANVELKWALE